MKKKFSKSVLMTALITGLCVGGGQGAFAADALQEFTLDPMIVTATRTEKNLMKVPASVSVITAQEIQERNVNSVREVLRQQPGLYMNPNQDAFGGIQMRGMNDANILFLYDGQPLSNAWNGGTGIEAIPIEQIERIEVVRGAASSLYGGRAVAGVINIISKKINGKKLDGNVIISGGSNDTWKKAIDVRAKVNDKWSFAVGYENRETDGVEGYRKQIKKITAPKKTDYTVDKKEDGAWIKDGEKNYNEAVAKYNQQVAEANSNETVNVPKTENSSSYDYIVGGRGARYQSTESYNAAVQYNFDEYKSLKYTYMHSKHEYRYNNPFTYVTGANTGKEYFKGSFWTQKNELINISYDSYLGYVSERETDYHILNYNDTKNLWMVNLGVQDVTRDGFSESSGAVSLEDNAAGDYSYYPCKNYNLDLQKTWENIGDHTITVGANWKDEQLTKDSFKMTNYKDLNSYYGASKESSRGKAKSMSVFIQDEYKINDPLTLYVGGRYDYYEKYDGWNSTKGDVPEESFSEFSPKVSLEYAPSDDLSYFISYGHSFNTPKLYNIYRETSSYAANPDLKPETSDTYEIGVKKRFDKTLLGVSLYKIKTDDVIDSITSPISNGKGGYKKWYTNLKEQERKGIEFEIKHEFNDKLLAYLNYAWQDGETTDNKGKTSEIYSIPKHLLHFGIDYNIGKFNAIVDAQYVSERNEDDDVISGAYGAEDAFFVMNTYFNYKLTPQATLQFGIDNIFDREYYADYATAGRTYNVSLRYTF